MTPFYIVYRPVGSIRFDFKTAQGEAKRLADLHKGEPIYVMRAVGVAQTDGVVYTPLEGADGWTQDEIDASRIR